MIPNSINTDMSPKSINVDRIWIYNINVDRIWIFIDTDTFPDSIHVNMFEYL